MKVFLSWSGNLSKQLAEAIRDWLPGVLQLVTPYFTPADIEKGARWSADIARELDSSQVGILCITRDNLHSDWILFEAGALSKSLDKAHVCPILFGITPTDLSGPLKQFQTTSFERTEMHKLISVINGRLGEQKLASKTLDSVFEKWWPDLEKRIDEILGAKALPEKPVRSDRELIEEILVLSRASSRRSIRPPVSFAAIKELVTHFIELHDDQADQVGGYQEVLDKLKDMSKAVVYITSRYSESSDEVEELVKQLRALPFRSISRNEQGEDDEIPF